ncbi:T9SS type A sorting domain-containing protein [Pontibacter sp. 13R65]|uniref:T9SS type A sorting domain-containing protein n=1 Tax=Pontibacter sp. 13R65 TaxID=3127458 RepID=UPI00301BD38A
MKRVLITLSSAVLALYGSVCAAQSTKTPSVERVQGKLAKVAMAHKAERLANLRLATIRVAQQETQSYWDAEEGDWLPEVHYTYAYNNQGLWESITERSLPENEVTKQSINITYDAQGNEIERTNQTRNGSAWVNESRERNEYDAQTGQLKLMAEDEWVNNAWQLASGTRYTYTTGTGNRIEQTLEEEYENGTWTNSSKTEYTYNGSGTNPVASTSSDWVNGAWQEVERMTEITYENGMMKSAIEEYYDEEEEEWVTTKGTYTYTTDAQNQTATIVLEQAMQAGQTWMPVIRMTIVSLTSGETYLGPQTLSELKTEANLGTTWGIIAHITTEITRDNDGQVTQIIAKSYDEETEEYVNLSRFEYSDFVNVNTTSAENEVLASALQLYPNPTQGNLKIALDPTKVQDASLSIHSLTGQKVYELNKVRGEAVVDMSQLPSGIYMVRVVDTNKAGITRKIIKQ